MVLNVPPEMGEAAGQAQGVLPDIYEIGRAHV